MFSDKLLTLLAEQGDAPDYQRLAADVLGIRGAPPALARTLVEQALLVTDWSDHWRKVGERAVQDAPRTPGVYLFRDGEGRALYVGKAANLRRRLCAHFAARKWRALPPALARVATVECEWLGSELEALLREAALIRELKPVVNIQTAAPSLKTRAIARSLVKDVVVLLPSAQSDATGPDGPDAAGPDVREVVVVAAQVEGSTRLLRTSRRGAEPGQVAAELWTFFAGPPDEAESGSAPLVFSWLAARGQHATRIDPHDFGSPDELRHGLEQLMADTDLFVERVVRVDSRRG